MNNRTARVGRVEHPLKPIGKDGLNKRQSVSIRDRARDGFFHSDPWRNNPKCPWKNNRRCQHVVRKVF
jgi:hypothetical protein